MLQRPLLKYKKIPLLFNSRAFASIGSLSSPSSQPAQPLPHQHLSLHKTPSELASRLVSTHLLLTRWALELQEKEPKKEGEERVGETYKTSDAQESLKKCIEHVGGKIAFTPIESKKILKTGLGEWGSEDLFSLEMRWESLGMLLWSLRILKDVPGYDQTFSKQDIYSAPALLPAMPKTIDTFLEYFTTGHGTKSDHIVGSHELWKQVSVAECWLWRARAQKVLDLHSYFQKTDDAGEEAANLKQKQYKAIPKSLKDVMQHIPQAIELGCQRAVDEGFLDPITQVVNGDFGVGGLSYGSLEDHKVRDLARVAEARVAALAWMTSSTTSTTTAALDSWDYKDGEVGFINPVGSIWAPGE